MEIFDSLFIVPFSSKNGVCNTVAQCGCSQCNVVAQCGCSGCQINTTAQCGCS